MLLLNIFSGDYEICKGVVVTFTPGHTSEDVTVIVKGQFNGHEAIVGITGKRIFFYK